MGDSRKIIERRKTLQTRMPGYYCPMCTTVAFEEDEHCLECKAERPSGEGWPALRDSLDPWLGRVLDGRYLLTKRIGQGSSASVYRAESLAISRQFAIKIIHPAKASGGPSPEQITARLEREIEALGRVRNPHVVRFYDVIELPLNHIGVVMDFVQGETVEELVEHGGALEPVRTGQILRQLSNGLYEAHLMGLVHRDLKPENIMVERLPAGDDFVHVLDFGIVHLEDEATMTQGFIGTPLYASPEQAMGEPVDHRSDIYSLGAIFFFMLSGRPPFLGNHVMQVLKQHVEKPPPLLASLRPDLQGVKQLDVLIGLMLAKDKQNRPQNLAEVIQALDEHMFTKSPFRHSSSFASVVQQDSSIEELSSELGVSTKGATAHLASHSSDLEVNSTSSLFVTTPKQREELLKHENETRGLSSTSSTAKMSSVNASVRQNFEPTFAQAPRFGEIDIPDDVDLSLFTCASDFRLAFIHEHTMHVYNVKTGEKRTFPLCMSPNIMTVALSDAFVLLGREDGTIERMNTETGLVTSLFESVFSDVVVSVAMSPNGKLMLAAMRSGRIYMSPPNKDERDWIRIRAGGRVDSMALSPRGDLFAIAREDGQIEISRIAEPKQIRLTISIGHPIESMAFSEDGYLLGLTTETKSIGLFQVINGMHLVDVNTEQNTPLSFFFSEDNNLMGFLTEEEKLYVADLQSLAQTN